MPNQKYILKNRITANVINFVDPLIDINQQDNISPQNENEVDNDESISLNSSSFKEWTKSIANVLSVNSGIGNKR